MNRAVGFASGRNIYHNAKKMIEEHQGFFMNSCTYSIITPSEQLIQS